MLIWYDTCLEITINHSSFILSNTYYCNEPFQSSDGAAMQSNIFERHSVFSATFTCQEIKLRSVCSWGIYLANQPLKTMVNGSAT